jgi:hypothetical protein
MQETLIRVNQVDHPAGIVTSGNPSLPPVSVQHNKLNYLQKINKLAIAFTY